MDDLPDLAEMDPEACYTSWDIILTTTSDINIIRDVFIFVEDSSDVSVESIHLLAPEMMMHRTRRSVRSCWSAAPSLRRTWIRR